jgi:hypothetical protein
MMEKRPTSLAWFTLFAVGAASAACSMTVGFDGFVGTSASLDETVPGSDAGPRAEGGTADPERDSEPIDAAEPLEAEAPDPNGPPVFVEGETFCDGQTGATFCDDFDKLDLPFHWVREGSWAKLTSHAARSKPNDFLVRVPPNTGGGTFVSKITRAFEEPSTDLVLAFDFFPEKLESGNSFLFLGALEYLAGKAKYSLRLVYLNGEIRLEESDLVPPPNNKDRYHSFFSVPVGKWSHVELDAVLEGGSPRVRISVDGLPVGPSMAVQPTEGMEPLPTLILGAVFAANPHSGWTLRYDNVAVTYR